MFGILTLAAAAMACPAQAAVLSAAARAVEQRYHDVEQGRRIASELNRWAHTGRYAGACAAPDRFVADLNRDLDAYDGHFHLERTGIEPAEQDWLMAWRQDGRTSNMGLRDVRRLEGNIGHLRLASFYPWDLAGAKFNAAWALLGDADALILDLRQNGGGDAETAGQVVRAFLGAPVSQVQTIVSRGKGRADPLPALDLPTIPENVPVAVLLDRRSASAAEFVAYSLQAAGRATIIGARSAGAASLLGEPVPIAPGFKISIPDAQPVSLKTGRNWEGAGVQPDARGGDDALYVARALLSSKIKDRAR